MASALRSSKTKKKKAKKTPYQEAIATCVVAEKERAQKCFDLLCRSNWADVPFTKHIECFEQADRTGRNALTAWGKVNDDLVQDMRYANASKKMKELIVEYDSQLKQSDPDHKDIADFLRDQLPYSPTLVKTDGNVKKLISDLNRPENGLADILLCRQQDVQRNIRGLLVLCYVTNDENFDPEAKIDRRSVTEDPAPTALYEALILSNISFMTFVNRFETNKDEFLSYGDFHAWFQKLIGKEGDTDTIDLVEDINIFKLPSRAVDLAPKSKKKKDDKKQKKDGDSDPRSDDEEDAPIKETATEEVKRLTKKMEAQNRKHKAELDKALAEIKELKQGQRDLVSGQAVQKQVDELRAEYGVTKDEVKTMLEMYRTCVLCKTVVPIIDPEKKTHIEMSSCKFCPGIWCPWSEEGKGKCLDSHRMSDEHEKIVADFAGEVRTEQTIIESRKKTRIGEKRKRA